MDVITHIKYIVMLKYTSHVKNLRKTGIFIKIKFTKYFLSQRLTLPNQFTRLYFNDV